MKSQKYVCGSQKFYLRVCEKLLIARADKNVLLNKHEFVSKCWIEINLKCLKDR